MFSERSAKPFSHRLFPECIRQMTGNKLTLFAQDNVNHLSSTIIIHLVLHNVYNFETQVKKYSRKVCK